MWAQILTDPWNIERDDGEITWAGINLSGSYLGRRPLLLRGSIYEDLTMHEKFGA
jgi:hypothetical protein